MSKLKKRILSEISKMKKELHIAEYIMWWILRALMITTAIVFVIQGEAPYQRNLILINLLATFAIPLLRFVSPEKLFTSKITFRTQSYIDIFVLLGSFLGHGLKFLGEVPEYDKFMHVIAGGVVVFIGAEVLKAFKGHENTAPGIKTFCGTGFSFIFIVLWEIMEFFADWFITNSNNQNYLGGPDENDIFIKIFGQGKNYPAQNPVYDTNADMFFAVIGAVICSIILYCLLSKKEKKAEKKEENKISIS